MSPCCGLQMSKKSQILGDSNGRKRRKTLASYRSEPENLNLIVA